MSPAKWMDLESAKMEAFIKFYLESRQEALDKGYDDLFTLDKDYSDWRRYYDDAVFALIDGEWQID